MGRRAQISRTLRRSIMLFDPRKNTRNIMNMFLLDLRKNLARKFQMLAKVIAIPPDLRQNILGILSTSLMYRRKSRAGILQRLRNFTTTHLDLPLSILKQSLTNRMKTLMTGKSIIRLLDLHQNTSLADQRKRYPQM